MPVAMAWIRLINSTLEIVSCQEHPMILCTLPEWNWPSILTCFWYRVHISLLYRSNVRITALQSVICGHLVSPLSLQTCAVSLPKDALALAILFDTGVFLAVLGAVMLALDSLSRFAWQPGMAQEFPMDINPLRDDLKEDEEKEQA